VSKESEWWDRWNSRYRAGAIGSVTLGLCWAVLAALETLESIPLGSLLEVGCGTGWFAEYLVGRWEYVGLDLSPAAIEIARNLVPAAHFEQCDFHTWIPPRERFDIILVVDTITSLRDQDLAVEKIADALRPNGWALVTAVNPFVYSRMRRVGPPGDGQVRKWLTKSELHALLKRHSLLPVRSWTVLPGGDMGILRWINAQRLNRPVASVIGEQRLRRAKELLGLGQYRIVVARKMTDGSRSAG
jgi:SAM-dependent methyltransferase